MSTETLNEQLLNQLECPVCFEICKTPIFMCTNGHIFCATCHAQLNECSFCRAPGQPTLRCVQLEKIAALVKLPCENQPHGCKLTFKIDDLEKHMTSCRFGFKCHICTKRQESAKEIKEHVLQMHPSKYTEFPSSGATTTWTRIPTEKKCHDRSYFNMFAFNGDIFWLEDVYSSATRIFSRTLRVVSHEARDASRYCYSMVFKANDENNELKVFHQADVLTEDAVRGDMDIVVPTSIVDSYQDGKIVYTLIISVKKQ